MTRTIFLLIFLVLGHISVSQELNQDDLEYVTEFVNNIRADLRPQIATKAHFPIRREYPIPPIADSIDFLKRFSDIFDQSLLKTIKNSKIPDDWSHVGWRGIMLGSGVLWIEDGGGLKAVNYQSAFEKNLRKSLIEKERSTLHPSLREYTEPTCLVTTEYYRIRVDKLKNGTYRYASWKKATDENSMPDLQISGGTVNFDGSGGNHRYIFTSGEFRYEIEILLMGADDDPPARLLVFKTDKEILIQAGTLKGD